MKLRLLVTIVLVAIMAVFIDVPKLLAAAARLDPYYVALAVSLLGAQRLFAALRWKIILDVHGVRSSFLELTKIMMISHSFGYVSPGGIGIEIARVYQAGAAYGALAAAISSVLLDRVVGLLSMLATALVVGVVLLPAAPELLPIVWGSAVAIAVVVGAVAALGTDAGRRAVRSVNGRLEWRFFARIAPKLDELVRSLGEHGRNVRLLAPIAALSLVMQAVRALTFWLIFAAMGADVSLLHCLVFVPLVFAVLAVPVSVGGLGVREGALAFFFGYVGVPAEQSIAAGLVLYALQLLFVAPGLLLFLSRPALPAAADHKSWMLTSASTPSPPSRPSRPSVKRS